MAVLLLSGLAALLCTASWIASVRSLPDDVDRPASSSKVSFRDKLSARYEEHPGSVTTSYACLAAAVGLWIAILLILFA